MWPTWFSYNLDSEINDVTLSNKSSKRVGFRQDPTSLLMGLSGSKMESLSPSLYLVGRYLLHGNPNSPIVIKLSQICNLISLVLVRNVSLLIELGELTALRA